MIHLRIALGCAMMHEKDIPKGAASKGTACAAAAKSLQRRLDLADQIRLLRNLFIGFGSAGRHGIQPHPLPIAGEDPDLIGQGCQFSLYAHYQIPPRIAYST